MRQTSGLGNSIALCHEWLTAYGGSEQVAAAIARALDIRDVYTFAADPVFAHNLLPGRTIRTPRIGKTGWAQDHWQWLLPVMPLAWRSLDLSGYRVVVTSSHACTNAVRVPPSVCHVSYCHTPMRYAWAWRSEIVRVPRAVRPLWPIGASLFRRWDKQWAQNVTLFVANSENVRRRIKRFYGRDSVVLYPPIDTAFWTPDEMSERQDFFLFAGRLVPYKRPEVAVVASGIAGVPLVVAGSGPQSRDLKRLAGRSIEFVPSPTREELRELYRRARALVFPGVEDFGMTLVEAQACGTPVIAYGRGGAREAVDDGRSGLLYEDPSPEGLAQILRSFDPGAFDQADIRRHVARFASPRFTAAIRALVGIAMDLPASPSRRMSIAE